MVETEPINAVIPMRASLRALLLTLAGLWDILVVGLAIAAGHWGVGPLLWSLFFALIVAAGSSWAAWRITDASVFIRASSVTMTAPFGAPVVIDRARIAEVVLSEEYNAQGKLWTPSLRMFDHSLAKISQLTRIGKADAQQEANYLTYLLGLDEESKHRVAAHHGPASPLATRIYADPDAALPPIAWGNDDPNGSPPPKAKKTRGL